VPATLMLFFVQDRLQASPQSEPLFLGSYFARAALAIPLWLEAGGAHRAWPAPGWRAWCCRLPVFVFASLLGAGDTLPFMLVCALSGVALGTDLAMPGALLAGVIAA